MKFREVQILSIKQIYNELQYCRRHGYMAPTLGKGTKCIKFLCSKASNFMFFPLIPMLFFFFFFHLRKIEFLFSLQAWKEVCDKLAISWLKVAITWANWRLSCHMQGFLQAWRSGIPFPQTLVSFPSNVLILSLKRSPTFPQMSAGTKRFLWVILSPWYFYWTPESS